MVDESVPLGLGVLGQETTGPGGICFALRTIPAMVALAEMMAERAPERVADQLHEPGRAWSPRRCSRCSATAPSASATRRRACAGGSPPRSGATPASCGSTTSASTTSAGSRACATTTASCSTACSTTTRGSPAFEEGRLFGGDWLRSLGMIPNEYLYYFYYAADTVDGDPRRARLARRVPARAAARVLRRNGEGPAAALAAWRATRHDRERTYMAEARAAAGDAPEHDTTEDGGYEREAMAVLEAIALNTRAVLILNTANRVEPAVPRRARGRRGAVGRRPRRAGPARGRRGAGPRARAHGADEGGRAHDDRRGAERLARRWR